MGTTISSAALGDCCCSLLQITMRMRLPFQKKTAAQSSSPSRTDISKHNVSAVASMEFESASEVQRQSRFLPRSCRASAIMWANR